MPEYERRKEVEQTRERLPKPNKTHISEKNIPWDEKQRAENHVTVVGAPEITMCGSVGASPMNNADIERESANERGWIRQLKLPKHK